MAEWTTGGDGCLRRSIVHPFGVPLQKILMGMAEIVGADARSVTFDGDYSCDTTIELPLKNNPHLDTLLVAMLGFSEEVKGMVMPENWDDNPMAKWLMERRFPGTPKNPGMKISMDITFKGESDE